MSPTLMARVDGLPAVLLKRERIFPAPKGPSANGRKTMSARKRARIERQTAAVHTAVLPTSVRLLLEPEPILGSEYLELEREDAELRAALDQAGVL